MFREQEGEEEEYDIDEQQEDVVETLAEVLAAARAVVEAARPGSDDIGAPMSALRWRIGRLPAAADAHSAHMACGSLLASRSGGISPHLNPLQKGPETTPTPHTARVLSAPLRRTLSSAITRNSRILAFRSFASGHSLVWSRLLEEARGCLGGWFSGRGRSASGG